MPYWHLSTAAITGLSRQMSYMLDSPAGTAHMRFRKVDRSGPQDHWRWSGRGIQQVSNVFFFKSLETPLTKATITLLQDTDELISTTLVSTEKSRIEKIYIKYIKQSLY